MDDSTRADMESRLGADFSDVRIHDNAAAKESAAEVGARAYTSGSQVVIGDHGNDKHTLAHELTHVIQQRQDPVAGTDNGNGLSVSDPSDRFEREAEANAAKVMRAPAPSRADAGSQNGDMEHRAAVDEREKETDGAIQRIATEEIDPPQGQLVSGEVPELSEELVAKIKNATTPDQRTEILGELYSHVFHDLNNRANEDDKKFYEEISPEKILIEYKDEEAGPGNPVALTETDTQGEVSLSFLRDAFKSPAILYSTVRHEFIHVAQRSGEPDDTAESSDDLIYAFAYEKSGLTEVQIPMQEIETHVWELENARRTGISADPAYVNETEEWLVSYARNLLAGVKKLRKGTVGADDFAGSLRYWSGYVEKTLGTLDRGITVMVNEVHRTAAISLKAEIGKELENRISGASQSKRKKKS